MARIKIFSSDNFPSLEIQINDWLGTQPEIEVKGISHSVSESHIPAPQGNLMQRVFTFTAIILFTGNQKD